LSVFLQLAFVTLAAVVFGGQGSQTPSANQYHIQTDEGPERYFRFQTDSGQFRKEKRLQDGTVIGTEAWIDAAGYLRQKDYIADKQGYRILKSKTIYVGLGRAVEDAIKSTKAAPAQSGVLVNGGSSGSSVNSLGNYQRPSYSYVSSTTSTTTPAPPLPLSLESIDTGVGKLNYLPPEQAAKIEPQGQLGFDHYPDELPRARDQVLSTISGPVVHIQPNAEPLPEEELNAINVYDAEADRAFGHGQFGSVISSTTVRPPSLPSLDMLPPLSAHRRRLRPRPTPAPIGIVSSTPAPIAGGNLYGYSTPQPFVAPPYQYSPSSTAAPSTGYGYYAPVQSPLEVNSLEAALLPPLPSSAYRRRLRPRPVQSNHLEGLAASGYDGVGTTRNGFRYVLPKQYHEEETSPSDGKRAGSFGYVDPFGIRRVVYYNAAPGRGFVHRNNNQYVGANGAPFDEPGPAQLVNE
ncbi:hypothetical protein KR074_008187, partial [Drosophila pseudoananassae]